METDVSTFVVVGGIDYCLCSLSVLQNVLVTLHYDIKIINCYMHVTD